MNHFANNGKEYLKRMKENNKYRQGRSREQLRASYIGAFIGIVGMAILSLLYFIFKISMRNAILEVFKELEEKFVMKDLYETKIEAVEDRLDKLERTRENTR